jgi:predicted dehydrogenase
VKELRCGVVGLRRGRLFAETFDALPGCRTVAVCDTDPAALERFGRPAGHADYDAFLGEGLDVVAVATPGPVHAEQSVRALRAGAHVLCETPCVYSLDEARAVLAAAADTGRRFMLAEDYLWAGWVEALKARIDAGLLGQIVYAEGDYTHDCRDLMLADAGGFVPYAGRAARPDARKTWRATHLPPILYCSHTLGPLLHLMDDRAVSAVGLAAAVSAAPDLGTIGAQAALLETAGGAVIRLTNGFSVACPMTFYYNLAGTAGSVRVVYDGTLRVRWYSERGDPATRGWEDFPGDVSVRRDGQAPVAAMVREFVESIVEDRPAPLDAVRSMEFVLPGVVAHESARRGGAKLEVPDLRA